MVPTCFVFGKGARSQRNKMARTKKTARQNAGENPMLPVPTAAQRSQPPPGQKNINMTLPPHGKQPRKRRARHGMKALREIRRYQKSNELLVRKLPFQRLVREIAYDVAVKSYRFQSGAILALQVTISCSLSALYGFACRNTRITTSLVTQGWLFFSRRQQKHILCTSYRPQIFVQFTPNESPYIQRTSSWLADLEVNTKKTRLQGRKELNLVGRLGTHHEDKQDCNDVKNILLQDERNGHEST